eukprot:scaffold237432_cov25-Prasinocladus_malaysianus.AAC.1
MEERKGHTMKPEGGSILDVSQHSRGSSRLLSPADLLGKKMSCSLPRRAVAHLEGSCPDSVPAWWPKHGMVVQISSHPAGKCKLYYDPV